MRTSSQHYQEKYGCHVYRLSLDGGFTCPNRDGTKGTGGCRFCSPRGGGDFAAKKCESIREQLEHAKDLISFKLKADTRFIAYFQSFTGTYAPVERLRKLYLSAIEPEYIVGLTIGTRPDCLGDDVIALLKEINEIKPVSIELGLQTSSDFTAAAINRGYTYDIYLDAIRKLKEAGIETVTHIILGLPGETVETAVKTTKDVVLAGTDGLKFHLLHIMKGSAMEADYQRSLIRCLSMEEYGDWLTACLACVPENITVHRITGDGAKKELIAPLWSGDKKKVLNYLNKRIADMKRDSNLFKEN